MRGRNPAIAKTQYNYNILSSVLIEDLSVCLKAVLHISQGIVLEHGQNKQTQSNIQSEPRWNQCSLQLSQISLTITHCGYSVENAYDFRC